MHAAFRSTLVIAAALLGACKEHPPEIKGGPTPLPSEMAAASESVATKPPHPIVKPQEAVTDKDRFPLGDEVLQQLLNPSKATEYTGPTGVVEGTITVKGDPPAIRTFQTLPKECEAAKAISRLAVWFCRERCRNSN